MSIYGNGQDRLINTHNPKVVGSNPAAATRNKDYVVEHSPFVIWLRIDFCDGVAFRIMDNVADKK